MTNWIMAISDTLIMIATVFLAIVAWQAKKGFLQESLYNDSWELYRNWNDLINWMFSNRVQLDEELLTKEKAYNNLFRQKLDTISFLYSRVKHLYKDELRGLGLLLNDLDSVWLTYATKQNSREVDKYRLGIINKLTTNNEIALHLYNGIINNMK